MHAPPLVSIVVPVYDDADVVAGALDSCLRQSLTAIEIIVVDDASTDGSASVVEEYAARDPRVRLIRHQRNSSAYQARRTGILAARAEHLLFLDGDDELAEGAAAVALAKATATGADLVQFGVDVIHVDGRTGGPFEARLQPKHALLEGDEVLRRLFPLNGPAQGQLWRYLFRTQILADAYAVMPEDLVLPRVNDLPIMFLTATLATRMVSLPDRLYRYHFGRGGSGQRIHDLETAAFYASAIRSVDSIGPAVQIISDRSESSHFALSVYASVRLAIIGYTTHYLVEHTRSGLLDAVIADLCSRASVHDIVQSVALHWPKALDALAAHASAIPLAERPVKSVVIATNHLRTGGISNVVISQARLMRDSGLLVTIAAREPGSNTNSVPDGVDFVEVPSDNLSASLTAWAELCRSNRVDTVIDHQWQYSTSWQAFALAARAVGVSTIGWSHNFAGRSLLLGLDRLETAPHYFDLLKHLVVLSPLDVAFWKLRGMARVSYLPNPPSSQLLSSGIVSTPRTAPMGRRVELIWWGRLQERTKRVTELLDVAEQLERNGLDFRLRIVGPDWRDLSASKLNTIARARGLGSRVQAIGPLHGAELIAVVDSSDIFVNTSIIEGYPLTIPEAQSRGLPVIMYELPWLAVAVENHGIVSTKWGDSKALADQIRTITADPEAYARASAASIEAATRELRHDFAALYRELLTDTIPVERTKEPMPEDIRQLVALVVQFSEDAAARQGPRPRAALATTSARGTTPFTHAAKAALDLAPWLRPIAQRLRRRR